LFYIAVFGETRIRWWHGMRNTGRLRIDYTLRRA
jgi:hypothetical protein